MATADHTYIFIVTYGRSGSTVLQNLLQAIPGYFVRGENMNILYQLYNSYKAAHDARYDHGKKPHGPDDPWYGANEIEPENVRRRLIDTFVEEILRPPKDVRVVGFKEIRFHEAGPEHFENFLNFIHGSFPGCKFIFNSRPWEEVSRSGWWAKMDPVRVKEVITGADALYTDYLVAHPERGILLHQHITREDAAAFKPLFEFLGEHYDHETVAAITGKKLAHTGI